MRVADLVGGLTKADGGGRADGVDAIGLMTAAIVIPALGACLIGADLEAALGLEQGCVRNFVADGIGRVVN
jgi:hypothetical protein